MRKEQDIVVEKFIEFNVLLGRPDADCVYYFDCSSDSYECTVEDFSLTFYKREKINSNATIEYRELGGYRCCIYKDELKAKYKMKDLDEFSILQESEKTKVFYVYDWLQKESRYKLWTIKPDSGVYQGCGSVYDMSLEYGDSLVYWTRGKEKKFVKYKELEKQTTEILETKYQKLKEMAINRNYKPGWIYYKLCEEAESVNRLWAEYGFYFPLEQKIRAFSNR